MKVKLYATTAVALLALAVHSANAEETVGYNHLVVPANTDVFLTAPFTQDAAGTFTVVAVTGSGVTVAGPLNVDEFAGAFYVRFTSGGGNGLWSTVTGNTAMELTLQDPSILASVSAGDTFIVFPHETLETAFPDGMESVSYEASAALFNRSTEILVPDTSSVGINKSAAATYYYLNGDWRRVGSSPLVSFNDTILPPQQYFVHRNGSDNELTFLTLGNVAAIPVARLLGTQAQDNDVAGGAGFPTKLTLADLNLGGTDAFVTTTVVFNRQDELLVFDNTSPGINKAAAATYFYFNGAWRRVGASPATSFDDEVLDPGSALLIRKAGGTPKTSTWSQPVPF